MTVLDQLTYMPDRLAAAADHVEETHRAYQLAVEHRNRLIIDAVDSGMPQRLVARAARVSQPHVVRVLSRQDDLTATTPPPPADAG